MPPFMPRNENETMQATMRMPQMVNDFFVASMNLKCGALCLRVSLEVNVRLSHLSFFILAL